MSPCDASQSPFVYFGGKVTIAPRIVSLLPAHRHYVEPYGGGLSVLLAKPRSPMETVNDLSGDLMTLWRVLRERPDDLERVCALTPHSRLEHLEAYERPDDLDDLERARRVWVLLSQGRGGQLNRTGWRHYAQPAGGASMSTYLQAYVRRIAPCAERLTGVSLECRPALELVEKYGRYDDVLLYLDPPYLGSTRRWGNLYQHEMRGADEHRELADAARVARAAVVVSGYPSDLYDLELYSDWQRTEIATATGQGGQEWSARTEVLWSNRPLEQPPATLWDEP